MNSFKQLRFLLYLTAPYLDLQCLFDSDCPEDYTYYCGNHLPNTQEETSWVRLLASSAGFIDVRDDVKLKSDARASTEGWDKHAVQRKLSSEMG